MAIYTVDESQRKAARVVGFTYLFALVTANFADAYVPSKLFVHGNALETARNILAHERLFRIGVASDLTTFITDVVLIAALYVVLKPVNRNLALLAAFWRLVETSIMVVVVLNRFDVLRLLSGAVYLRAFDADRLQGLTMLSIGAYGDGYNVGLMFFGLGSTVFGYLWLKSRYIPAALAALGVFGSLLLAVSIFTFIVFPNLADIVGAWCYVPIGIFELTTGFWLLIRGLRQPARLSPAK